MKHTFLFLLALLAAFAARAEVVNVDSAEVARLVASGVVLVDIRTEPEWRETGVIPGSRLLTFFDANGRANPAAWLEQLKTVAGPEQPVILICRSGNRTRVVSDFLEQQAGYSKIYNVRQGIRAWIQESRPVTAVAPALAKCSPGRLC